MAKKEIKLNILDVDFDAVDVQKEMVGFTRYIFGSEEPINGLFAELKSWIIENKTALRFYQLTDYHFEIVDILSIMNAKGKLRVNKGDFTVSGIIDSINDKLNFSESDYVLVLE